MDLLKIAGLRRPEELLPPVGLRYACLNARMFAATIDSVCMLLLAPLIDAVFMFFYPVQPFTLSPDMLQNTQELVRSLRESGQLDRFVANATLHIWIYLLLSVAFWMWWGATPGKRLMRMRVVEVNTGAPITLVQAMLRAMGYVVSGTFLMLGFFWVSFNKRRRGWHDFLAGTCVVVMAKPADRVVLPSHSPEP